LRFNRFSTSRRNNQPSRYDDLTLMYVALFSWLWPRRWWPFNVKSSSFDAVVCRHVCSFPLPGFFFAGRETQVKSKRGASCKK
jgi:hypothetical protein